VEKKSAKKFRFKKRDGIFLVVGILSAFLVRFALVDAHVVHYHANFALYVDGQRDLFDNFTFYEEVAACSTEANFDPKSRTHLHGNVNSVIHVHDAGVTWGAFFANIGYIVSDSYLESRTDQYVEPSYRVRFVLNGQEVESIYNRTIESEDRLLVDVSRSNNEDIMTRYNSVPNDAEESNATPDPASCSGAHGESLMERLRRTLGITGSGNKTKNTHDDLDDH
jgi:hypothetical protein